MANPFPFTAGQVLTADQMNGIGEVLTYTPTITNLTLGNGNLFGRYVQIQKLVYLQIGLVFGSTTSITGAPTFSLPVTCQTTRATNLALCQMLDSGVTYYLGGAGLSTTVATPYVSVASGTYLSTPTANISATVPMTWAVNDDLRIFAVYEAA